MEATLYPIILIPASHMSSVLEFELHAKAGVIKT